MPLIGKEKVSEAITVGVKTSTNKKLRAIYLSGYRDVIKGTPVGNPDLWTYKHPTKGYIDYIGWFGDADGYVGGRARSNWFITSMVPSTAIRNNIDKSGAASTKEIVGMSKDVLNKKIYFTNNLPYISRLEYGGHSSQAPKGWVRSALILMRNKIRAL